MEDSVVPARVERWKDFGHLVQQDLFPETLDVPNSDPKNFVPPANSVPEIHPSDLISKIQPFWKEGYVAGEGHPHGHDGSGDLVSETSLDDPKTFVPPAFEHDGRLGQFVINLASYAMAPHIARAVWDAVWPLAVRQIPPQPDGTQGLHVLAFCSLFRKLEADEQVPPYSFEFNETENGVEVSVTEMPMPDKKPSLLIPNRAMRRHPNNR